MTAPFEDRQKVSAEKWDKTVPKWQRMGICIVVGQRRAKCESGWMVNVMAYDDGTSLELDANWLKAT